MKDPRGIKAWWTVENLESFDGLPALRSAHDSSVPPVNTFDKKAPHPSLGQIRAAEKKAAEAQRGKSSSGEGTRLVMAFGVGVMVTMGYVRFVASRVPVCW